MIPMRLLVLSLFLPVAVPFWLQAFTGFERYPPARIFGSVTLSGNQIMPGDYTTIQLDVQVTDTATHAITNITLNSLANDGSFTFDIPGSPNAFTVRFSLTLDDLFIPIGLPYGGIVDGVRSGDLLKVDLNAGPEELTVASSWLTFDSTEETAQQRIEFFNPRAASETHAFRVQPGFPGNDLSLLNATNEANGSRFLEAEVTFNQFGEGYLVLQYSGPVVPELMDEGLVITEIDSDSIQSVSNPVIQKDQNNVFSMMFPSEPGTYYRIQFSNNLFDWTAQSPLIYSSSNQLLWIEEGLGTYNFFRLAREQ